MSKSCQEDTQLSRASLPPLHSHLRGLRDSLDEGVLLNLTYSKVSLRGVADQLTAVAKERYDKSGFFTPFANVSSSQVDLRELLDIRRAARSRTLYILHITYYSSMKDDL